MDLLRGVVERLTYHNEETGYTVAKLTPEMRGQSSFGQNREVAVVGTIDRCGSGILKMAPSDLF